MKKIILVVMAISFLFNFGAHAQDVKQYTCSSIYSQIYAKKLMREENYNRKFNDVRGDASLNTFLGIALFMGSAATGSLPIVVAATLTPAIISAIVNLPSKEERVLRLREETSKQFERFLKRLQRNISESITVEEVEEVMQSGFDSGLYCDNLPRLASPVEIRKHVRKTLKAKYIIK